MSGDWWKVGVWQGRAMFSKALKAMPYKLVCWFDADAGAWTFSASTSLTFKSGWTTRELAKAKPAGDATYDFWNCTWEVLWPDSEASVKMLPRSSMLKAQALCETSSAGSEAWL